MAAIEQRFGDALAFEIALNQSALSREELRRHLRDSLRIDTYLRQRFASAIQGPGDDVEAQRTAFVRQWVEGLRRRGAVQLLYLLGPGFGRKSRCNQCRAVRAPASDRPSSTEAHDLSNCARLKPAWLIIGAMMLCRFQ